MCGRITWIWLIRLKLCDNFCVKQYFFPGLKNGLSLHSWPVKASCKHGNPFRHCRWGTGMRVAANFISISIEEGTECCLEACLWCTTRFSPQRFDSNKRRGATAFCSWKQRSGRQQKLQNSTNKSKIKCMELKNNVGMRIQASTHKWKQMDKKWDQTEFWHVLFCSKLLRFPVPFWWLVFGLSQTSWSMSQFFSFSLDLFDSCLVPVLVIVIDTTTLGHCCSVFTQFLFVVPPVGAAYCLVTEPLMGH